MGAGGGGELDPGQVRGGDLGEEGVGRGRLEGIEVVGGRGLELGRHVGGGCLWGDRDMAGQAIDHRRIQKVRRRYLVLGWEGVGGYLWVDTHTHAHTHSKPTFTNAAEGVMRSGSSLIASLAVQWKIKM